MTPARGSPLGIEGRQAIVCGSSKDLGYACAEALALAGADVVINGRTDSTLAEASERLDAKIGRPVTAVVADVHQGEGRKRLIAACRDPNILVTNGGPRPGHFEDWGEAEWHSAFAGEHGGADPANPRSSGRHAVPPLGAGSTTSHHAR